MRIAIASDHGGFELKRRLIEYLRGRPDVEFVDMGCHGTESVDYPDFALLVALGVSGGEFDRGVMVDGAGIGSCMTANKVPGVRAALCHDAYTARNSRAHNDANVLCLGGQVLGPARAVDVLAVWLDTDFEGGRHARRVGKIMETERRFLLEAARLGGGGLHGAR